MKYTPENLVVRSTMHPEDPTLRVRVTPESAGWDYINFEVRHLEADETLPIATGENELALVNMTGRYAAATNRGAWEFGGRENPFTGAAHTLYLPRHTEGIVTALEAGDLAVTWVATDEDHEPWLIAPEDVPISIRGGDNVSRQINDLLPPGSPVHRLVLVEVYTPSGNWSSYPPHKHDVHTVASDGTLLEADLEEVYYYRFDKPNGYAYQRIYTDERSPMHQAGNPLDVMLIARDEDVLLIPEGYHPVTSAPGYTTYYLNVLAGSAQSLANQDDPRYTWVKQQYAHPDSRLPLY